MREIQPHYDIKNEKKFEEKERQGLKTVFSFYVPYHILLYPEDKFEIRMSKNPQKTHVIQVINRSAYTLYQNGKFFGYDEVNDEEKEKTVLVRNGDRFGITGYSKIVIIYDRFINILNKEGEVEKEELVKTIEIICEVFNYFLDIYCAIVKHRQALKLSPHDVHTLEFSHLDKESVKHNEIKFSSIHGATITDNFISPPESVIKRLKEVLLSADPNIAKYSLGINAVRHVFSGEYLSGIVQAVTELESCLYEVYEEKLKIREISDFKSILGRIGLNEMVELLKLILTNDELSIVKSKVDLDIVKQAITARNKYIHEGIDTLVGINNFTQAEKFIIEINRLCVELVRLINLDHILDEEKTGWN